MFILMFKINKDLDEIKGIQKNGKKLKLLDKEGRKKATIKINNNLMPKYKEKSIIGKI